MNAPGPATLFTESTFPSIIKLSGLIRCFFLLLLLATEMKTFSGGIRVDNPIIPPPCQTSIRGPIGPVDRTRKTHPIQIKGQSEATLKAELNFSNQQAALITNWWTRFINAPSITGHQHVIYSLCLYESMTRSIHALCYDNSHYSYSTPNVQQKNRF